MATLNAVNITREDFQANRRGNLSQAQCQILSRRRLLFLAAMLGWIGLLAAFLILLFFKLRFPSFASRGELYFWIPVGLFWLYLLRLAPIKLRETLLDLREGKIARVEGRVLCRWRNTLGLIQFAKYEIVIEGEVFSLSGDEFFEFINQGEYQVIYAPRSRIFLGAVPLSAARDAAVDPVAQGDMLQPVSDRLNQRELEILALLSEGLSNKEVALRLSLSTNTIKMYTSHIYRKIGVSRRTEAIAWARNRGILK